MQDKKMTTDCILLSIPVEMFEEAGIGKDELIQITAEKGKIIISNESDVDNFVCDGDCASCPVGELGCEACCELNYDAEEEYYDDEYESEVY